LLNSYVGDTSGKNNSFNIELFKKRLADSALYSPTMTKNTQVLVADLRKQRELVEYSIIELEEIIKIQ
jgi:replication initiation and membrane attachment protein DnaB